MHRRTAPLLIVSAMILAMAVRVALAWAELPDVMASHFGAAGRPNGWQGKASFFVTYSVLMGFTLGVLLALGKLLHRMPARAINIPHRDYWLVPERRPEAIARLTASMDGYSIAITAMLTGTLELTIRANLTGQPLDSTLMTALLVAFFAVTVGWLIHLIRRFKPE